MDKRQFKIRVSGDVGQFELGKITGLIEALAGFGSLYPILGYPDGKKKPFVKQKTSHYVFKVVTYESTYYQIVGTLQQFYPNVCSFEQV